MSLENGGKRIEGQPTSLIKFIAHELEEFPEPVLLLRVVALDYNVLKMPEPTEEVVEALAPLQITSDLRAELLQCVHTTV